MKTSGIERLEHLCREIPALLKTISESEFSQKPLINKWSKKEIIGHLIDSAANNHHRFVRCQFEDYTITPYQQNNWVSHSYYQQLPSKELITFWSAYNRHLANMIKQFPSGTLQQTCKMQDGSTVTLAFLIDDYVEHLEHHLHQVIGYQW